MEDFNNLFASEDIIFLLIEAVIIHIKSLRLIYFRQIVTQAISFILSK